MNLQKIGAAIGSVKGGVAPDLWFQPLRLTNTGEGVATVSFSDVENLGTALSIRKDDTKAFKSWDLSAITLQHGEYVEFIGKNDSISGFLGRFSTTGANISASGTVMSIVYGESMTQEQNTIMTSNSFGFYKGTPIGLFGQCENLVSAPELPATTLYSNCYKGMFYGCTSLTEAPELPATNLEGGCYQSMFYGCTSLTEAPELPATNLEGGCYQDMFNGCTDLNKITVSFESWELQFTSDWLANVAATGTFTCPAGLDTTTRDGSHVPDNWTVVNA